MHRNGLLLAAGASVLLAIVACHAVAVDAGTSESAHTVGELANGNSPFFWAESRYEDFSRIEEQGTPIDDHDPLTVRLQAWADRYDAIVRAQETQTFKAPFVAPKPIVKVLPATTTFNAWVTGIDACITQPAPSDAGALLVTQLERDTTIQDFDCVHPASWSSASAFADFWNASKPVCRISIDDAGAIQLGSGCQDSHPPAYVGTTAASPFVHVTTDLIAALDERTVAVILAHELGHYYRAHVSPTVKPKYDFWFERDANQAKRPVPAADAAELTKAYDEIVNAPRPLGGAQEVGRYSARLRPFLLKGIAPLLEERTEPNFACAKARDALGPWVLTMLQEDVPNPDIDTKYLAWEAAFDECAPRVRLAGDPGEAAISMGRAITAALANAPRTHNITLRPFDPLSALVHQLDDLARKIDDRAARLLAHVRENRIGMYTIEQEADDFAMDLATRAGMSSDEVLEAWLSFIRALDGLYTEMPQWYRDKLTGGIDAKQCEAAFRSGFTTFIPLGMLDEPHHADCYRLFNLWREARTHRYEPGPAKGEMSPPWADLQNEARALSASPPASPLPAFGDVAEGGAD